MRNKFLIVLTILFVIISCSRKETSAPVLILATNAGFGTYTAEILKAEGFNEFQIDSIDRCNYKFKLFAELRFGNPGQNNCHKTAKNNAFGIC